MRRLMALAAAAAMVGTAALAPAPASAHPAATAPLAELPLLLPVQYYGAGPHHRDDRLERRRRWREFRQERDEARIAAAARREAHRIEAEREQRRAWRGAQHGYGPAYGFDRYRSW